MLFNDKICLKNEFKYEPCDLSECEMEQWENWGVCSKTCGGGQQVQRRKCNGNDCGSLERMQLIECATEKCLDVWSSWSAWSDCSLACGGGEQKKERLLIEGAGKVLINFTVILKMFVNKNINVSKTF